MIFSGLQKDWGGCGSRKEKEKTDEMTRKGEKTPLR